MNDRNTPGEASRTLVAAALLLALVLAAAVWVRFGGGLSGGTAELAQVAPGCDLATAQCAADFASGSTLRASIEPKPPRAAVPLTLAVATAGADVVGGTVEITGINMDMGYNRFPLERTADGLRGHLILPVCSSELMEWRVLIALDTVAGSVHAPMYLTTRGRGG